MLKKLLFLSCFSCFYANLFCQNWANGIDDNNFSGGFVLQYINAEYKILKKENWKEPFYDIQNNIQVTSRLKAVSSIPTLGFGIGGLINKRLLDHADLRLNPTFIFSDCIIKYEYEEEKFAVSESKTSLQLPIVIEKKVQATMIEFPIALKIKSDRLNNLRSYFLIGTKYSMDIASKKKTFDESEIPINKLLKNKRIYLSYEAAIGLDFYFEYFKASTEIKYSFTTSSILVAENNAFSNPIDKLMLRHLTVSLILQ